MPTCCVFSHASLPVCVPEFMGFQGQHIPLVPGSKISAEGGKAGAVQIMTPRSSKWSEVRWKRYNTQLQSQQEWGEAHSPKTGENPAQGLSMTLLFPARKYTFCRSAGKTNKQQQKNHPKQPNLKQTNKISPKDQTKIKRTIEQTNKKMLPKLKSLHQTSAKGLAASRSGGCCRLCSFPAGEVLGVRAEPVKPPAPNSWRAGSRRMIWL